MRRRGAMLFGIGKMQGMVSMIRLPTTLFAVLILIVAILVYAPAMQGTFVWDDDAHITNNPNMRDLAGLKRVWTSPAAYYYPLTSTTFWIGRRLWGLNPFPYHLLNLYLHLINAVLFGLILKQLRIPGGLFAAAVFALHPVHVESVGWITELKNVQCCFFYLLAVSSWIRFDSNPARPNFCWYAASILFFLLSLLSKPASIMLPMILLLISFYVRGGWTKATVALTLPFFMLSAAASGWTIWEQAAHSGAQGDEWSFAFLERVGIAGRAVWFYLGKLLWPHPLIFIYPRWQLDPKSPLFYAPIIAIFVSSCLVYLYRHKKVARAFAIAVAYFVLSLFPILGFFNIFFMRYSFVADHFQYLASLGPIAFFSASLWNQRRKVLWRFGISIIILFLLSGLTWQHAHVFQNAETLWYDTIEKNPSAWLAHNNLGTVLLERGSYEDAAKHYEEAIRLKSDLGEAHSNLGLVLTELKSYEEAIEHFRTALKIDSRSAVAYNGLGNALVGLGRDEEAIHHYKKAIELKPNFAPPHHNLAQEFLKRGDNRQARASLRKAQAIDLKRGEGSDLSF